MAEGLVRHPSRRSRSTQGQRPSPWTRKVLLGVGGNQRETGPVQGHPRIRVIGRRPRKGQAQNRGYRMTTQAPLVVGCSGPPSAGGRLYHQWQRERHEG